MEGIGIRISTSCTINGKRKERRRELGLGFRPAVPSMEKGKRDGGKKGRDTEEKGELGLRFRLAAPLVEKGKRGREKERWRGGEVEAEG